MSFVATQPVRSYTRTLERIDPSAIGTWVLGFALVLYLALEGGGYGIVVSSQVGLVVWWVVLIGAAWAILPTGRLARVGWWALGLFAAFTLWTALASTWSLSSERSLQELSRVATYLGIAVLAISIHRDRTVALRQTASAVGAAVTVVAILALISRLFPGSFPAATTTGALLNGAQPRLSWPLNYWNGLAALMAIGLPLLLSVATTARTLRGQAAAAAALPVVALCAYLTASRAGAIAIAVALVAFLALAADRIPKLATIVATGAGSAILIAGAVHRNAIQQGFTGHAASVEGKQLFVTILLVCAGVAIAQLGIGLATRHGRLAGVLRIPRREARVLLGGGIAVVIVAALAAGVPHRLSHAWHDFKYVNGNNLGTDLGTRLTTLKGEGRYQYWKVAVNATSGRRLQGSGPGTFQDLWLPRANNTGGYVTNAHSLYVETLAESGLVGLALLIGFLGVIIGAAILAVIRSRDGDRTAAAAATGALLAFIVAASVDWLWELPVVPAAFLLVAAAVLAPAPAIRAVRAVDEDQPPDDPPSRRRAPLALRAGLIVVAVACLAGIAVPLGTASNVQQSQREIDTGNAAAALADARTAARIEPGAASPRLQQALVLEAAQKFPAAVVAARDATRDEPQNWSPWLILSRVEAEAGHPQASVVAYNRARSLNPLSPIFAT
jgi:O-antigen ligase